MQFRIFDRIKIMSINELDTAWKVSLKEMADFVEYCYGKNGDLSAASKKEYAKVFYGHSLPQSLARLEAFIKNAISIRDKGYITPLNCCYEFDGANFIVARGLKIYLPAALPRILCGGQNLIDDGRHKLAILSALGVKRTPVIMMKIVNSNDSYINAFCRDVVNGIEAFKRSKEWKAYMETEDYKKTKPEMR